MKITVCLSIGQNPVTGRPRMARGDRAALALAANAGTVTGLHAGPESPVLMAYLGTGLAELRRIDLPGRQDILQPLLAQLRADPPELLIFGAASETGSGSGLLPYAIAEALGWPLLAQVTDLSCDGGLRAVQVAAGGTRRLRIGQGPAVLIADPCAGSTPLSHPAARRSGTLRCLPALAEALPLPEARTAPARIRSARLRAGAAETAATMLAEPGSATEAARCLLTFLRERALVPPRPETDPERAKNV